MNSFLGCGFLKKERIVGKTPLVFLCVLLFSIALCGTASASDLPLNTNSTGTVSGDLYVNATQQTPFNLQKSYEGTTQDVTYNFSTSYTNVTYAKLYTVVYCSSPEKREGAVNVSFDGNNDGVYETILENNTILNTGSVPDSGEVSWQNDHICKVYTDYLLSYDVTSYIKSGTVRAKVQTAPSSNGFDGRIKYIALVVAYNDGDYDRINYWVNDGFHWFSDGTSRSTNFDTNTLPAGWESAELDVVHTSTYDATYIFNGASKDGKDPAPATYFGFHTWNVTSDLKTGQTSTLEYLNFPGQSYKISLAALKVKYPQPTDLADIIPEVLVVPDTMVVNQSCTINSTIANRGLTNATAFQVEFYDGTNLLKTFNLDGLNAGSTTNLIFNWTPTTTGTHKIRVVVDTLNQIKEAKETNNGISKDLQVDPQRPDLTLVSTNLGVPETPAVNQTYHLNATVTNQGLVDAGPFQVDFYDGNTKIGSRSIVGLKAGSTISIPFDWTPTNPGSHNLKVLLDTLDQIDESNETNNQLTKFVWIREAGVINVFIIYDDLGNLNPAASDVLQTVPKVSIQLRTGTQVSGMTDDELCEYLKNCDVFIGEWIDTDTYPMLMRILTAHPEVADKGVFLILEPPASVNSNSVELMRYSSINGVRLISNTTTLTDLNSYYTNTKRGPDYSSVLAYVNGTVTNAVNLDDRFDKAVLYKDLNDRENFKNQILWALSLLGLKTSPKDPLYSSDKQDYGIYRYGWYKNLNDYMAKYFKSNRVGTVGLLESTMYIPNSLATYYAIIDALEAKGLNVIPVTAAGGTTAQLDVMLRYFTNATDLNDFINNTSKYTVKVDAVVDMVAYGLGGDDFSYVTQFFTAMNVPVIRAIHSNYETNEVYEMSTTGLRVLEGDKWWQIAVLEAQGLMDPTFVGGLKTTEDPSTGGTVGDYVPYTKNIELMATTIGNWIDLKYLTNSAKKIAMIYYNYPPGKQNIAASYLDPVESILNLLNVLKNQGYDVKNVPSNATILLSEMLAQGTNIANWASGLVDKLADNNSSLLAELLAYQDTNGNKIDFSKWNQSEVEKLADIPGVILYPVSDFMKWFNQLDDLTRLDVTQGPVAYIGELCKRAVEIKYINPNDGETIVKQRTQDMNDKLDSWYNQVYSLVPDDKLNAATPILKNIVSTLKKYVVSGNVTDYNQYLVYKNKFLALNITGMSGWGEFPGNIMAVTRNGTRYFVLPGIQFGNVLIAPEPQRGWEGNAEQIYHNSVVAPHYQYLAFYAYLQQKGYDAMVFMGRHATHEWLPGKEVLGSYDDFPSIVTGGTPQIYFYIVDGVGEGLTAKRRGSAVIIDHLTPPMGFTQLYGGMSDLEALVEDYDGADSTKKAEIITKIKKTITDNHLEADIGANINSLTADKLIAAVDSYLTDLANTFYPYGVDVIGKKWTDDQIALLVTSMLSVPYLVDNQTNSTDNLNTTSLQNEVALVTKGKPYDDLTAGEQNTVQNRCVELIKQLIHSDVATVASGLTSNPSKNLKTALEKAVVYINTINESVENEVKSFLNALNGGYIAPGLGNDPINNPGALSTGKNFYQDQAAEIPTWEAYLKAKGLTLTALASQNDTVKKIVVGIWDVETARDNGELVSMVLYLLGMEPQWSSSPSAGSNGKKVQEMPTYTNLKDLVRPDGWSKKRIDVVVVIDGNMRDLYSRQLGLIDNAFRIALARSYYTIVSNKTLTAKYGDKVKTAMDAIMLGIGNYGRGSESLNDNYVAYDWVKDFCYYMDKGMNCTDAGELAISRIFAPPENDYGAMIAQSSRSSWTWNSSSELGSNYLDRMGHIYSSKNWGTYSADAFIRALTGVSTVYTSRNTNLYGVLDNDDFFDYWGGLSLAMTEVNGKAPDMYVLKYGNGIETKSMSIEQFVNRELNTRLYNPDWIKGMMDNGYAGAGYISKYASNMWEAQVTRPGAVQSWMWDKMADVYIKDKYNLGVTQWLENDANSYAMTSMTGTMLTALYKGYWTTDTETLKQIVNKWVSGPIMNGVACCDCSCGNIAMMKWAMQYVNPDMLAQFKSQLYAATKNSAFAPTSPGQTQLDPSTSKEEQQQQQSAVQKGQPNSSGNEPTTESSKESGEGSQSDVGDQGNSQGKKSYEISKTSSSSSSQTGMPVAAIIGVVLLVGLVGIGYFRGRLRT